MVVASTFCQPVFRGTLSFRRESNGFAFMVKIVQPDTTDGLRVATVRWLNVLAALTLAYVAFLLFRIAYLAWTLGDVPDPQLAWTPAQGPWREHPELRPPLARLLYCPAFALACSLASFAVRFNLAAALLGGTSAMLLILVNSYFAWLLR